MPLLLLLPLLLPDLEENILPAREPNDDNPYLAAL